MDAYYYGFDSTGNDAIDLVLSAVASAGKAFHSTDCWTDEAEPSEYNERLRGSTMVEGIQNAANDAAKLLAERDAEIERLKGELRAELAMARLRIQWEVDAKAEIERLRANEEAANSHAMSTAADNERLAEENAELRADLVWAVRKGVMVSHDENLRPCVWFDVHRGVECDGTPESICRAVREARDGE